MATILLVDDDKEVLLLNKKYLMGEGFTVLATNEPLKGIEFVKKQPIDCIILDVMMPGLDGFSVCKKIREFSQTPIIFLTGRVSEEDKLNGLMNGGDDYILKPYSLKELTARIHVILRRLSPQTVTINQNQITHGDLVIDKLEHKALFKGIDLGLANREYEVMLYLANHPNKEITFEELGNELFGCYTENDRRLVMVNVSRLRKKMSIDPELEKMLETVWSKGYRFVTQ